VSRRSSSVVLAACLLLVGATALTYLGGVVAGAWAPGGPPRATPPPTPFPAAATSAIEAFLDEVREGRVVAVTQRGVELEVQAVDRTYTIELPNEQFDIYSPMANAAQQGGVPMPEVTMAGPPAEQVTYQAFLERVATGTVSDLIHEGDRLTGYWEDRSIETTVPAGVENVLADIEAAAERGGVPAPYYTKVPAGTPD
jgi:hypothetical protein